MKNIILVILLFLFSTIYAQESEKFSFGITLGYNYNSNGEYVTNGGFTNITNQFASDKKSGFHGGAYLQHYSNHMYLRPELLYTRTKSNYNSASFNQSKLEMPLIIGFDIVKPISVFIGGSFQYLLLNEFEGFDAEQIDIENDLSVNFQGGIGVQFHKQFRFSIRFEKGIADNILTIKDDATGILNQLNTRPEQLILSLSFRL
ncbi:MAG: outer membrane beta-barrel protein [Flavobacteriaceae bacterium]